MKTGLIVVLVVVVVVAVAALAAGSDWPQFRGPDACGVDAKARTPVRWNIEKGVNLRWRTPIPGFCMMWEVHGQPPRFSNRALEP